MKNNMLFIAIVLFIIGNLSFCSIIEEKVLICGTVKNLEKQLPHTIKNIKIISRIFKDSKVIVYENNSTDDTKNILKNWKKSNKNVHVICEDFSNNQLHELCISRLPYNPLGKVEILAMARNKILDEIFSGNYNDFKYVILLDMDLKFPRSFHNELIKVLNAKEEWDAVFANSSHFSTPLRMYDLFAFRSTSMPLGPEFIKNRDWWDWIGRNDLNYTNMKHWIPVYSAFGGFGIYKKESMRNARYSAFINEDIEYITKQIIKNPIVNKSFWVVNYYNELKRLQKTNAIGDLSNIIDTLTHENLSSAIKKHPVFRISNDSDSLYFIGEQDYANFPIICEHVTFHYKMIRNGHNKLFLNPALRLTYF